tara:strand:- start:279 stop:485 length:207 start_codon:yes stop_codon:yes gene_type:complete
MNDKPITVEDYEQVADEFFAKYHFVAKELGEGAKSEDILKIMENLTGLVMKKRKEDKSTGAIGFNKDE